MTDNIVVVAVVAAATFSSIKKRTKKLFLSSSHFLITLPLSRAPSSPIKQYAKQVPLSLFLVLLFFFENRKPKGIPPKRKNKVEKNE